MTSFSTRSTRVASDGGSIASALRLRSGRPISRKSVRKVSVTTLSTEPTSAPVMPSSEDAASGIFCAASCARFWALFVMSVCSFSCWNERLVLQIVEVVGQIADETAHLVPDRDGRPDDEHRDDQEQQGEDEQRRLSAPHPAAGEPSHQRVESEREHERKADHEQDVARHDRQVDAERDERRLQDGRRGDDDLDSFVAERAAARAVVRLGAHPRGCSLAARTQSGAAARPPGATGQVPPGVRGREPPGGILLT